MQIIINVPEKEFSTEIEDKFQDFFKRLEVEIKEHLITNTSLLCGAYELETIDMFLKSFKKATPLPKGHGRIVDIDKVLEEMRATKTYDIPFALERVKPIIGEDKK